MANLIALVGKSGWGKSTSLIPQTIKSLVEGEKDIEIIGLDPKKTIIINTTSKPLPGKGSKAMFPRGTSLSSGATDVRTNKPEVVATMIKAVDIESKYAHIENVVIEDAQYLQMFRFMDKIMQDGWEKFNLTGEAAYLPLKAALNCARDNLNIIFTYHPEKEDNGDVKIKTAGKVVDAYITIEGLFTTVLYTKSIFDPVKGVSKYYFMTQNDGSNTAKSPPGMFDKLLIPNDMGYVVKKMKEYYG